MSSRGTMGQEDLKLPFTQLVPQPLERCFPWALEFDGQDGLCPSPQEPLDPPRGLPLTLASQFSGQEGPGNPLPGGSPNFPK